MLTIVLGTYGSGKTLFLTAMALMNKNKPIYANYVLKLPTFQELSIYDLVSNKYSECVVLMDEMYAYLESRCSGKVLNEVLSYVLFQSRKKGLEIIGSAQLFSTIDVRYRKMADFVVLCEKLSKDYFQYEILNVVENSSYKMRLKNDRCKQLYSLYDTKQIIASDLQTKFDKQLLTNKDAFRQSKLFLQELQQTYQCLSVKDFKAWCIEHISNKDIRYNTYILLKQLDMIKKETILLTDVSSQSSSLPKQHGGETNG